MKLTYFLALNTSLNSIIELYQVCYILKLSPSFFIFLPLFRPLFAWPAWERIKRRSFLFCSFIYSVSWRCLFGVRECKKRETETEGVEVSRLNGLAKRIRANGYSLQGQIIHSSAPKPPAYPNAPHWSRDQG